MHSKIGFTAQKCVFEFLGKKPFPALFFERPLDALIAGGDDFQQLDFDSERSTQVRGNLLGLSEGERALTGGEDERFQSSE